MLQAYNRLLKELEKKQDAEMKPEETVAQRKRAKAVEVADAASSVSIASQIATLKTDIGRTLNELADRLEQETAVKAIEGPSASRSGTQGVGSPLASRVPSGLQKMSGNHAEAGRVRGSFACYAPTTWVSIPRRTDSFGCRSPYNGDHRSAAEQNRHWFAAVNRL